MSDPGNTLYTYRRSGTRWVLADAIAIEYDDVFPSSLISIAASQHGVLWGDPGASDGYNAESGAMLYLPREPAVR